MPNHSRKNPARQVGGKEKVGSVISTNHLKVQQKKVARPAGFEPTTPWFVERSPGALSLI